MKLPSTIRFFDDDIKKAFYKLEYERKFKY